MLKRLIGEDISLVQRHEPLVTTTRVDRGQIEQVLLNLVLNARDAMPRGGVLTIRSALVVVDAELAQNHLDLTPGRYVVLSVSDTGVGMTPEVQARAFDPFFTTKQPGQGTGIGLSIVYGIVKQSSGTVWIESAPGSGTTVHIYLPHVDERPERQEHALVPRPSTRSATILLAEDEPKVRELLRLALARAGHVVLSAENGRVALELARSHDGPIDVLVTDVVMPFLGGQDLASRMRVDRPDLAVLYVSGYSSDGQRLAGTRSLETAYLQKPFTSAQLIERVGALITRPATFTRAE
jgi:CheY-like chemotaxis protein